MTIIGVHGNEIKGQPPVASGVKDYKITYPVVDDVNKQVWNQYSIVSQPSWALIAKDGTLIKRQVGMATTDEARQRIEAALK